MRAFIDYNTTQEYTDFKRLPAGAYEVEIIRAEDSDKALCLLFDIRGGDFDSYFKKKLAADRKSTTIQNPKFKGVYRLWYPDGGEWDDNKKRRMKTALKLIAEENNLRIDFTREWDGAALKGAKIGMIFQDRQWEYQGKTGWTAQPYGLISLGNLRAGEFEIPKPKSLGVAAQSASDSFGYSDAPDLTDDDLPF